MELVVCPEIRRHNIAVDKALDHVFGYAVAST